METPSSTRRVTRSQTIAALNNSSSSVSISRKIEDAAEKGRRRSGSKNNNNNQQDRSALIDITNDSPIVGVAMGSSETPLSKQRSNRMMKMMKTPGSGEALLRGQVKALLQKVEEEAELSKISFENRPFLHLQGFVNSPTGLLAPTPANTPQILNLSGDAEIDNNNGGSASFTPLPVIEEQLKICQVVSEIFDGKKQGSIESQKSLTRSLLLDFSEKSEVCDSTSSSELSSVVTTDEDSASNWSIQVNASNHDEDEEDQVFEEEEEAEIDEDEEEYFEDEEDGGWIDELCEGIGKINMNNDSMAAAKFEGKRKKFEYNSDDEIVEENSSKGCSSPSILRLKGLPTPKGKHLRFPMEKEEEE